jgi:hypothetical protein
LISIRKLGRVAEINSKSKGRVGADRAPAFRDLVDAAGRDTEVDRQFVLRNSERRKEFFGKDLARVNRCCFVIFTSVIIDDLDRVSMAAEPFEAARRSYLAATERCPQPSAWRIADSKSPWKPPAIPKGIRVPSRQRLRSEGRGVSGQNSGAQTPKEEIGDFR